VLALLERVALAAAQEVLNRAYGKPHQSVEIETKTRIRAGENRTVTMKPSRPGPVTTGVQQDGRSATWFRPGQSGNPKGRPKGSRHKLGEDFLAALQQDFEAHGVSVIEKVREERPHEYLKVIASILPKELYVRADSIEELSDDELEAGIKILRAMIASEEEAEDPLSRH
jgi:hypothetical protein